MKYILDTDRQRVLVLKESLMERLRANSKAIGSAAELGDLSENSEFEEAKREQEQIKERLALVNSYVSGPMVVRAKDLTPDFITLGNTVHLEGEGGTTKRFVMISCIPRTELDEISCSSVVGQLLIGKVVGDTVVLNDCAPYTIKSFSVSE